MIKFNETSSKVGADIFITESGVERRVKPGDLKEVTGILGIKNEHIS